MHALCTVSSNWIACRFTYINSLAPAIKRIFSIAEKLKPIWVTLIETETRFNWSIDTAAATSRHHRHRLAHLRCERTILNPVFRFSFFLFFSFSLSLVCHFEYAIRLAAKCWWQVVRCDWSENVMNVTIVAARYKYTIQLIWHTRNSRMKTFWMRYLKFKRFIEVWCIWTMESVIWKWNVVHRRRRAATMHRNRCRFRFMSKRFWLTIKNQRQIRYQLDLVN